MKPNPSNSAFGKSELKYLGHTISHEGYKTDPEKVSAITTYPIPKMYMIYVTVYDSFVIIENSKRICKTCCTFK